MVSRKSSGMQVMPKLYIASHDLKKRYNRELELGAENRLKAYVESVQRSRNVGVSSETKENGTVEFAFHAEQDNLVHVEGLKEAKRDIQGELCSVRVVANLSPSPHPYLSAAPYQGGASLLFEANTLSGKPPLGQAPSHLSGKVPLRQAPSRRQAPSHTS